MEEGKEQEEDITSIGQQVGGYHPADLVKAMELIGDGDKRSADDADFQAREKEP